MGQETRRQGRDRRHERVRERIRGSAGRPRLAVFRSISHIYAQLIDDESGRTLVAASSLDVRPPKAAAAPPDEAAPKAEPAEKGGKTQLAKTVGRMLGERAKASGIAEAVFDRGGYRYHGRVKALGDAARSAGLRF